MSIRKLQSDLQARSHDLEVYIPYVSVTPRDIDWLCSIEIPLNAQSRILPVQKVNFISAGAGNDFLYGT